MRIELVRIEGCQGAAVAASRLREALEVLRMSGTDVEEIVLRTPEDAAAASFAGSPTILVDGRDLFPGGDSLDTLACRVYATDAGLADAPSVDQIVDALRDRAAPTE